MQNVLYKNSYITLLAEEEILNPYSVLEETFEMCSSAIPIQDELFELIMLSVRRNHSLVYESPLVPYRKYKKLVRLFEAGWLIHKIRPNSNVSEFFITPFEHIVSNGFESLEDNTRTSYAMNGYRTLINIFSTRCLTAIRIELYRVFFDGLDPDDVLSTYEENTEGLLHQMYSLIEALYIVYLDEPNRLLSTLDFNILTREMDRFKERETLYDYDSEFYEIDDFSRKDRFISVLRLSRKVLNSDDFWRRYANPANMLYYFHDFLFIIDASWCYYRTFLTADGDVDLKWRYPESVYAELDKSKKSWIKRPLKHLQSQFEKKSIYDWRNQLERCLEDVLSNECSGNAYAEYNDLFVFVEDLLVLSDHTMFSLSGE